MKLREVFDKPTKFVWTQKNKTSWVGKFRSAGLIYELTIERYVDDFYSIVFEAKSDPSDNSVRIGRVTHKGSTKIINSGNAIEVFATVSKAVDEFIKTVNPKTIEFRASEKSRQKLYRRFVGLIKKKYGYEEDPNSTENTFVLRKV